MRFGNNPGLSFPMPPCVLAMGNVCDHTLVFMSLLQEDIWAFFFELHVSLAHWEIFGPRGVATRVCNSGDHFIAPRLGIFLASFTEVKFSGLGGGWDHRKSVVCQACPYSTPERDTSEHSSRGLIHCSTIFTSKNF